MHVAHESGRVVVIACCQQLGDALVLVNRCVFPLLEELIPLGEIIESLLQGVDDPVQGGVARQLDVGVVEGQVQAVEAGEVVGVQRGLHARVEPGHRFGVLGAEPAAATQNRAALQRADDLVDVSDVLQGQGGHIDPAAGQEADESFCLQHDERVTQRRLAHAQAVANGIQIDGVTGAQFLPAELVAQVIVHLLLECFQVQLVSVVHGSTSCDRHCGVEIESNTINKFQKLLSNEIVLHVFSNVKY